MHAHAQNAPERVAPPPCLASLHDVMPETWPLVIEVLDWLKRKGVPPVSLLIVPGRNWEPHHLERIQAWADEGHPLIAHGWYHHVETIRGLRHRLHSAFISRKVAEHLALPSNEILTLLRRAKNWFAEQALPAPQTYIPPAWALGPISPADLKEVPYKRIEVTRGLLSPDGKLQKLPLTGFEADTAVREKLLRCWNKREVHRARTQAKPLRLSLHPYDLKLRLKDQLETIVEMPWTYVNYDQV